jgi:hypothetical protein
MADVNRFSEGLIDAAERFADIVDSAQGKGARKGGLGAKWLILPAPGQRRSAAPLGRRQGHSRTPKLGRCRPRRPPQLPQRAQFYLVRCEQAVVSQYGFRNTREEGFFLPPGGGKPPLERFQSFNRRGGEKRKAVPTIRA